MSCVICGSYVNQVGSFKPRIYCSDNCRDFAKYKNALERCILLLKPDTEAKKVIRGDMFRLANLLSNGTNKSGVLK